MELLQTLHCWKLTVSALVTLATFILVPRIFSPCFHHLLGFDGVRRARRLVGTVNLLAGFLNILHVFKCVIVSTVCKQEIKTALNIMMQNNPTHGISSNNK